MQRCGERKGQVAIEYLTNYGWIILVGLTSTIVLSQMGAFNPTSCGNMRTGFSQVIPVDWRVSILSEQMLIFSRSWSGDPIELNEVNVSFTGGGSCVLSGAHIYLEPDQSTWIVLDCSGIGNYNENDCYTTRVEYVYTNLRSGNLDASRGKIRGSFEVLLITTTIATTTTTLSTTTTTLSTTTTTTTVTSTTTSTTSTSTTTTTTTLISCFEGWTLKRPVVLQNTGSSLTVYSVTVNVSYDSDMRSDFGDIVFGGDDNVSVLNYWMENYTSSSKAVFWVRVASIPSGNSTIYFYYGNSSKSTASNGSRTFSAFDDYESDSWTYSENGASFSGSLATDAWVSASHAYKLVYPSSTASSAGYYGRYTKPMDVGSGSRKMRMSLKDSYTGGTSGYHKKQVYIGATKYYDADVSGGTTDWTDTGWVDISSTT